MFDAIQSIMNFAGFFFGGGMVVYILLMLFAPSLIGVLAEYLKALAPLVRGAAELFVAVMKVTLDVLWNGFKDIADNLKTILTVVALCTVSLLYGMSQSDTVIMEGAQKTSFIKRYIYKYRTKKSKRPQYRDNRDNVIERFNPMKRRN